mmetsp:Transcript_11525/g.15868  ORF Transcript_11525/g.15868 Transcript_11525/m.15868 type:complete len:228 (+) Transcript_11525:1442-2125(+)
MPRTASKEKRASCSTSTCGACSSRSCLRMSWSSTTSSLKYSSRHCSTEVRGFRTSRVRQWNRWKVTLHILRARYCTSDRRVPWKNLLMTVEATRSSAAFREESSTSRPRPLCLAFTTLHSSPSISFSSLEGFLSSFSITTVSPSLGPLALPTSSCSESSRKVRNSMASSWRGLRLPEATDRWKAPMSLGMNRLAFRAAVLVGCGVWGSVEGPSRWENSLRRDRNSSQ